MKTLHVPHVVPLGCIRQEFDRLAANCTHFCLECVNWADRFPYKPAVSVQMGWNTTGFYLIFQVQEQQTLATNITPRGAVCKDSCVEAFLSFDGGGSYYNFEFNAVGCINAAHHSLIANFKNVFSEMQVKQITVITPFEKSTPLNLSDTAWELRTQLPAKLFAEELNVQASLTANFYKCGDELKVPHYVSWCPIVSEEPSFHCPQFFGRLELMSDQSSSSDTGAG